MICALYMDQNPSEPTFETVCS